MISRFLAIVVFLSLVPGIELLRGQCTVSNTVFRDGEQVEYEVSYNWGPVWVNAGLVTFSVIRETKDGKELWHLKSTGKTYSSYDFFFKVRDYYDSWIDPETFRAASFQRYIYEGGYTLVNSMRFDHENRQVFSTTKSNNNPVRFDTLKPGPCTFDMISAVYYTRCLELTNLKPDERVPVNVMIDDSIYHIYIRFLGREMVKDLDGDMYRCIKFSAKMVEGTIFRGDEDVLVWVTDDRNRIPVYIEARILVGTVKAYLKEMKGLRNPVTSLVK